jgi:hypothetical protein
VFRKFRKVRSLSYDSAVFDGRRFDARYSTDTGAELRMRGELDGLDPDAAAAVDTDRYARLWGLASFGALFWPLLPIRLEVAAFSLEPEEEERCRAWFLGFLSENFYRSGQPAELDLHFSGERLAPRRSAPGLGERAILMSGGGKESAVSGELLESLGIPFRWYSSSARKDPAVDAVAEVSGRAPAITGVSFLEIKGRRGFEKLRPARLRRDYRRARKRLATMHWHSLMGPAVQACLVAEATSSRYVLVGNERSANEGNGLRIGDLDVNHQYSKSYPFEHEFAQLVAKYLHPELRYASLLMPLYELQIARLFAAYPQYLPAFRSCNRRNRGEISWCRRCPKCAFVFLVLAAFLDEDRVAGIFEADLLADPGLVETFLELCGRGEHKPLECVGEQDESRLALWLASKRRTALLHPDLAAVLPSAAEADELQGRILGAYNDENGLPPRWNDHLRAMVRA